MISIREYAKDKGVTASVCIANDENSVTRYETELKGSYSHKQGRTRFLRLMKLVAILGSSIDNVQVLL